MKHRIVHITKATGMYGSEKHLLTLLPALTRDYQVACIVLKESKKPVDDYLHLLGSAGIEVYPLVADHDIVPRTFTQLRKLLCSITPALVHTHLIHGDVYGILAATATGCRCIVSTRHNDDTFRRRLPVKIVNRLLARRIKTLIAISDWVATFAHTVEGIPREKIITIHYGIDPPPCEHPAQSVRSALGLTEEHILCGITARLVEQKGHHDLITAFALAAAQCPRLRLVIAGDGPLRSELEAQVRSHCPEGSVFFTGYRRDIGDVLASLDVFVHPSRWEGFGLAILEAMALGIPVIGTRVSAIPELVGDAGILVAPRDSAALADAMVQLARDPSLRHNLGRAAHLRYRTMFSVANMVEKTAAVYEALLARV